MVKTFAVESEGIGNNHFMYCDQNGKHIVSGENVSNALLLKIWTMCKQRFPGGSMEYLRATDHPETEPHTDPSPLAA